MEYKIYESSITGYKNILKGNKSQDHIEYKISRDYIIAAVADGHSTDFFEYSKEGANFACMAAIDVLENYICKYKGEINYIEEFIEKKEIQRDIYEKWVYLVECHHNKIKPIVENVKYIKYGTTLSAILITNDFKIYLKLGDSSIIIRKENIYKNVFKHEYINNIVDSMSDSMSWKKMKTYIEKGIDKSKSQWVILFTDGFENSFVSTEDMLGSLDKTIYEYTKNIFSKKKLLEGYEKYLMKLSKNSTLDDISILFINII